MNNKIYYAYKNAYSSKEKVNARALTIEAIILFLFIAILATSCSKESSVQLRLPNRSNVIAQTITVDVRTYNFNGYWIIELTHPALVTVETTLVLSNGTFTTPVGFRQTARNVGTKQPIDIKLIEAKGQKNTLYNLNFAK